MKQKNPILISGAGIAGLFLARQFKKQGIAYVLIEKKSTLDAIGAGIALPANAVRALRYVGLSEALNEMHQVKQIIYAKANGRVISQASLLEPPLNKDKFVALKRANLLEILRKDVDNIYFNTSITALRQLDKGVEVTCSDSALNGEYDAVIGADGLYSNVRELGFSNASPLVDLGITNWRWILEYPTHKLQPTYMLGMRNGFLAYPIGRNHVYCYAQQIDAVNQYDKKEKAREHLKTFFSSYGGIAKPLIELLPENPEIYTGRLRSVPEPLFYEGDLALVGDASNACSPMLQQGAAAAFEDTIILSALLRKYASVREAFKQYETMRAERVRWIVKTSDDGIRASVNLKSKWAMILRNAFIRKKGPLNVQGWRYLLSTCPIEEISNMFIQEEETLI